MPVYPNCEFSLLDTAQTINVIRSAVTAREPFSLIRLGDGEAIVLSLGDDTALDDLAYLQGHWGSDGVSLGAVGEVKRDLEEALRGADIVGIRDDIVNVSLPPDLLSRPRAEVRDFVRTAFRMREEERDQLTEIGARRLALLHRGLSHIEWTDAQRFCSAWIHWELLASGELNQLLDSVTEVGLITARPELEDLVSRRFDLDARVVLVPDKFVEAPNVGRHVPDRYHAIRSDFDFPEGSLVLVGAGIPGKAYCQWLKEEGCVAIDVGSVFDAWVGKASRPRVLESRFRVAGGDRVPLEIQLQAVSSGHRRLNPRWKACGPPR